jgi:hypothetical protein
VSSAANAGIQNTLDSSVSGAESNGQQGSALSLSTATSAVLSQAVFVPPSTVSAIGLNDSQPQNLSLGSSATAVSANLAGNSIHSTVADVRPTVAGGNLTSSQVSPRGRTDFETNAPPPPNASSLIASEALTTGSSAGLDHRSGSDQPYVSENASYRPDKPLVSAGARQGPALELFSIDFIFGEHGQPRQTSSEAHRLERPQAEEPVLVLSQDEAEESAGIATARGAGLLGSPMPFDVDALAREAQQFFEQIDQLSQDLASLLAQMNLPPWSVAVAVVAAAAAVARRRLQRNQRGLVLDGCTGSAFACYPGLGGLTWEES